MAARERQVEPRSIEAELGCAFRQRPPEARCEAAEYCDLEDRRAGGVIFKPPQCRPDVRRNRDRNVTDVEDARMHIDRNQFAESVPDRAQAADPQKARVEPV